MDSIIAKSHATARRYPLIFALAIEVLSLMSLVLVAVGIKKLVVSRRTHTWDEYVNCGYNCSRNIHHTWKDSASLGTLIAGIIFALLSSALVLFFRNTGLIWLPWRAYTSDGTGLADLKHGTPEHVDVLQPNVNLPELKMPPVYQQQVPLHNLQMPDSAQGQRAINAWMAYL